MGRLNSGSRPLGVMKALLAFVLSAAMGVAFVMLVNKTHYLFSRAAFEDGSPTWQPRWGGANRRSSVPGRVNGTTCLQ